jgi:hypothetical protein
MLEIGRKKSPTSNDPIGKDEESRKSKPSTPEFHVSLSTSNIHSCARSHRTSPRKWRTIMQPFIEIPHHSLTHSKKKNRPTCSFKACDNLALVSCKVLSASTTRFCIP